MTKRCYHIEHQRLVTGEGYRACEPHRACRVVIIETTNVPRKGGRKAYQIKRNVQVFSGSAMCLRARALLDSLTAKTKPKPHKPNVLFRSLTILEYDSINNRTCEEGSY